MERHRTPAKALSWAARRRCRVCFRICSGPAAARPGAGSSKRIFGMSFPDETLRVGFVVKRYPRYSETFVVREILAHERAGLEIQIFSLRPSDDTHFQDLIARLRRPLDPLCFPAPGLQPDVLTSSSVTAANFLLRLADAGLVVPA